MESLISSLDKVAQILSSLLHYLSNTILLFMTFLITFNVIGRYFFNQPILGAFELTEQSSALLVFFALAVTHQYKEHIAIGFLVDKLSVKLRHSIEGIIEVVIFIVVLVMSWAVLQEAFRMMNRGVTTSDLSLVVYPFIIVASAGLLIFALTAFTNSLKHFVKVVSTHES
ncbi:TRAP-type C4-dicarboxylate transport system permease small subunit [Salsuginibacillus halophilus]|uniref:TRAP-type C4-dicarboxylate transport system permease small subunit n=1 Tax=Salsuginibacillus halophilus TaxID=517424 RepID=A0A2P8HQI3_9BACI|nr:TRAP transporter small permease [Salsuginibacillus halophilus]PSL48479.1 TRAP-type C4-dicarboxylate transport system permease small subunit [Salsuginibacillus halophilus]